VSLAAIIKAAIEDLAPIAREKSIETEARWPGYLV